MVTKEGADYRHASRRRGSVAANVRPVIQPADGRSFFVAGATYPISDDRTKSLSWRALSRDPSFFCHPVGAVIAPRALAPFLRILVISPLDGVCGDPKTVGHIVVSVGGASSISMRSFKRSRPIIRLSISKWQRSTAAVMTARLIMSSVWGAVGFQHVSMLLR
jgi:hypothetical protein